MGREEKASQPRAASCCHQCQGVFWGENQPNWGSRGAKLHPWGCRWGSQGVTADGRVPQRPLRVPPAPTCATVGRFCCQTSLPARAMAFPPQGLVSRQPKEPFLALKGYETCGRGGGQESLKKSRGVVCPPPQPSHRLPKRAGNVPAAIQAQIVPLPPSACQPAADGRCRGVENFAGK